MIKNIKISTKLYVLVSLTSLIILLISIYVLDNLGNLNSSLESVFKDRVIPLKQLKVISDMYAVDIANTTHKIKNGSIHPKTGKQMITKARTTIGDSWRLYLSSNIDAEEKKVATQIDELMKNSDGSLILLENLIEKEDTAALGQFAVKDLYPQIDPITAKINELMDIQLLAAEAEYQRGDSIYKKVKLNSYLFLGFGVLLALVISMYIAKNIHNTIKNASVVASKLSEGDLTVEFDTSVKDEIGFLLTDLKKMIGKFKEVILYVKSASDNIVSASQELSISSQQLSEGATEQAAATEEVSSSMEEMVAGVQHNSENAQQTQQIASRASQDALEGSVAVNQAGISMKSIANKITIISDIARQTNILALNAAVEAARAGDQGRGFAVVAAEVRKLAEKSQLAAVEINELSQSSVTIAERSKNLLDQMVPNIQQTSKLVEEISASSVEQHSGAGQINKALQQLSQVTQQNAATSEEVAASAEELSSQADMLKEIISFFKSENDAKPKAPSSQKVHLPYKKVQPRKNNFPAKPKSNGIAPKSGISLNMDSLDEEYEKF